MNDFIGAVSQVGFPIVVSLLLLIRIEGNQQKQADKMSEKMDEMGRKMDANTAATNRLTGLIDERIPRLRRGE